MLKCLLILLSLQVKNIFFLQDFYFKLIYSLNEYRKVNDNKESFSDKYN